MGNTAGFSSVTNGRLRVANRLNGFAPCIKPLKRLPDQSRQLHRLKPGANDILDRQQKLGDVECSPWFAQTADICRPFAPLFCVVRKRALHLRDDFSW